MKMYEMWLNLLNDREVPPSKTSILISASPLDTDNLKLLLEATKNYPTCYITEVYAIKNAVEQLRDLINSLHYLRKTHGENILAKVQVNMPVGNSFFMEIAKLRAFRLLWAQEISSEVLPFLHIFTSPMSLTEDINQNKIQATTQCLAGIIGNADLVTVTPSDARTGSISDASRRIARNVQHLLRLEGQLDKVADASAGSYYIEKMTADLVAAVVGA
jgi:methylmalonyl-CoA mutase N-terminal domain/subunit